MTVGPLDRPSLHALERRSYDAFWMPAKLGELSAATDRPIVLIVEDDPETRSLYQSIFEDGGFRIEQAHNGLQALEKAVEALPDLILTDIAVPGIDGIELCRRLRADPRTRGIPLLAVTGYGDRQYDNRAVDAGAARVLIKPCDADELLAEAERLVNGGRA